MKRNEKKKENRKTKFLPKKRFFDKLCVRTMELQNYYSILQRETDVGTNTHAFALNPLT